MRNVVLMSLGVLVLLAGPAAANMIANGGFEDGFRPFYALDQETPGTVSSAASQTGYDKLTATDMLPYRDNNAKHYCRDRSGHFVKFTSGNLVDETSLITEDINTDNKTAATMSYEVLSELPAAGDTFEIYSAMPNSWTRTWHKFNNDPPASKETVITKSDSASLQLDDFGQNYEIQQTLDLTANVNYVLDYWVRCNRNDALNVGVIIRERIDLPDSTDWSIVTNDRAIVTTPDVWEKREVSFTPDHDMTVQVELGFTRFANKGDPCVYFDDVSMVPEPATIAMLLLGLLGLVRRRK